MKFYSQNGEDYLLSKLFQNKTSGFYIEVGAFDGIYLSNTYAFEKIGWTGICIEPHPEYFPLCNDNRPNSLNVHVACVATDDELKAEFFVEDLGTLSGLVGGEERREDVKRRLGSYDIEFDDFSTVLVSTQTLNTILSKLYKGQAIDFVSIDVEGSELQVLEGFDLNQYKPQVIVIEANTEQAFLEIEAYLKKFHYILARKLGSNLFFVGEGDIDSFKILLDADIRCEIEPLLHPKGSKYTPERYQTRRVLSILSLNQLSRPMYKKLYSFLKRSLKALINS